MDSPYESDASEGMRELVERGYAIRRDSDYVSPVRGHQGETRALIRDLDVSHVQRPLTLNVSAGAASTHVLTPATQSLVTAAGRNNIIVSLKIDIILCSEFVSATLFLGGKL